MKRNLAGLIVTFIVVISAPGYSEDLNEARNIYEKCSEYLVDCECDKAMDCYNKMIKMYPTSPFSYSGRGDTYLLMGKKAEALENYKKSCDLMKEGNIEPSLFYDPCYFYQEIKSGVLDDSISNPPCR